MKLFRTTRIKHLPSGEASSDFAVGLAKGIHSGSFKSPMRLATETANTIASKRTIL